MKYIGQLFLFSLLTVLFVGCGKDNYDEPKAMLQGQLTYNGEKVQVRGSAQATRLQLYQDGYALHDPITVYVTQDGSFSAELFNGDYKLVTTSGNGPWVNNRDTTYVTVKGNTTVNKEVTPYYTISNCKMSVSGRVLTASFSINKVVSTATISSIQVLVNKTSFVDAVYYIFRQNVTATGTTVSVTADMSSNADVAKASHLFGRIAVRANGAESANYSEVIQLN